MTTIKSCTDLEQSKVLGKILPIESADNVITSFGTRDGVKTVVMSSETLNTIRTPFSDIREVTPCWSLAALLSVIRKALNYTIYGMRNICISYDLGDKPWEDELKAYDNEIDACYEMIIKLHEQKIL